MIQVHRNSNILPKFNKAVITIGTFDGVHKGHQQVIRQLKEEAFSIGGETVIITFHPHPRSIVANGKKQVQILNMVDEKIELLDKKGIDHLVIVPFTEEFSNQSAEEYVKDFLVEKFNPHTIIIGYDHKFGKNRAGDYQLLEKLGDKYGFIVREIPERILNEVTISSTAIREALLNCDIKTANDFLGYEYFFEGLVIEGNKIGRTLGFPTANLEIQDPEKLIPGNGVYAVEVSLQGNSPRLNGMMNIGFRPTVDGTKRVIEVNIFDFDKEIYGQTIRIYVKDYLRGEVKFNGLEALKNQLAKDKILAIEKLS